MIYEYGFGFTVITKSARILRDLEILQKINEKTNVVMDNSRLTAFLMKQLHQKIAVWAFDYILISICSDILGVGVDTGATAVLWPNGVVFGGDW